MKVEDDESEEDEEQGDEKEEGGRSEEEEEENEKENEEEVEEVSPRAARRKKRGMTEHKFEVGDFVMAVYRTSGCLHKWTKTKTKLASLMSISTTWKELAGTSSDGQNRMIGSSLSRRTS